MPPALRRPPAPPRFPSVRILAKRSELSERLDETDVDYVNWPELTERFPFRQGEHITLVGKTGSGKTTLAIGGLLPMRDFVVVMATKMEDSSLYKPLLKQGFVISDKPELDAKKHRKIIFKPKISDLSKDSRAAQAEGFRNVLTYAFAEGNWTIYMDEIRYLSDNLKLETELETLWLQGRSLGITMIAATQNPVSIPLVAFDQASHLFLWRQTDKYRVDRMAEFAGSEARTVRALVPVLPRHEALYVRTIDDLLVRTIYQP